MRNTEKTGSLIRWRRSNKSCRRSKGIESEQGLVVANREPLERFEQKIAITLARVWGEDETA